jgi:hypothetical protein
MNDEYAALASFSLFDVATSTNNRSTIDDDAAAIWHCYLYYRQYDVAMQSMARKVQPLYKQNKQNEWFAESMIFRVCMISIDPIQVVVHYQARYLILSSLLLTSDFSSSLQIYNLFSDAMTTPTLAQCVVSTLAENIREPW